MHCIRVVLAYTCYYDCFSVDDIGSNTFHAVYVVGSNSESVIDVIQCGFALCPKDYSQKDETIGFRQPCAVESMENNFTENLEREEMIGLDYGAIFRGSMIHCNLHECISGLIVLNSLEAVIEKCNFVGNKPEGKRHQLIYNGQKAILKDCVIAHNTHISIFHLEESDEIISCFFCGNTFSHSGDEICIPTLILDIINAESCEKGSCIFTNRKVSWMRRIFFHLVILK